MLVIQYYVLLVLMPINEMGFSYRSNIFCFYSQFAASTCPVVLFISIFAF
jgi:hypothetical protein